MCIHGLAAFVPMTGIGLISIPISPPIVGSTVFIIPASINCVSDNVKIIWKNVTDEENLDIVLDGDKLRVVHSRLSRYLLISRGDFYPNRIETKCRLVLEQLWLRPFFDNNSVFFRLGPFLVAALPIICQDWTARNLASCYTLAVRQ